MGEKNPVDSADMIYIQALPFPVGTNNSDKIHELEPGTAHGGFWIYAYPITIEQFNAFLEATHQDKLPYEEITFRYPITQITDEEAYKYAEWTGGSLPKETEWEIAARGSNGSIYPCGEDRKMAKEWSYKKDMNVGSNIVNHSSLSVYDIWGHVREWTTTEHDEIMIRGSSFAKQETALCLNGVNYQNMARVFMLLR